jgi:hypothetical protein
MSTVIREGGMPGFMQKGVKGTKGEKGESKKHEKMEKKGKRKNCE